MSKKTKRFFRKLKMDLLRLAVYAVIILVTIFAILFIVSIPELIGWLIFG